METIRKTILLLGRGFLTHVKNEYGEHFLPQLGPKPPMHTLAWNNVLMASTQGRNFSSESPLSLEPLPSISRWNLSVKTLSPWQPALVSGTPSRPRQFPQPLKHLLCGILTCPILSMHKAAFMLSLLHPLLKTAISQHVQLKWMVAWDYTETERGTCLE